MIEHKFVEYGFGSLSIYKYKLGSTGVFRRTARLNEIHDNNAAIIS